MVKMQYADAGGTCLIFNANENTDTRISKYFLISGTSRLYCRPNYALNDALLSHYQKVALPIFPPWWFLSKHHWIKEKEKFPIIPS